VMLHHLTGTVAMDIDYISIAHRCYGQCNADIIIVRHCCGPL
jgi:hypothetical protein